MTEKDENGVSKVGEYRDPEGRLLVELNILLGGAARCGSLRSLLLVRQHERSIALCEEQTDCLMISITVIPHDGLLAKCVFYFHFFYHDVCGCMIFDGPIVPKIKTILILYYITCHQL